jgi:hypothetical protein
MVDITVEKAQPEQQCADQTTSSLRSSQTPDKMIQAPEQSGARAGSWSGVDLLKPTEEIAMPALADRRVAIARMYTAGFQDLEELDTPASRPDVQHAWHLYPLRLDLEHLTISRAQFIEELRARFVNASVHFIPVHEHTYYREKYGWRPEDFPVAHREFTRMLSLPIYPLMTDDDVDDVVAAVRAIVTKYRRRI